jgi:sugar lactone lactonase YvrE
MTVRAGIWDDRPCRLGEAAFWHPERGQLFWVDIVGRRLLSREDDAPLAWDWEEAISALGWIDRDTLLVAGASGLWRFDIASGARERIAALEDDRPDTRSNDGRADPRGGFWVGTMGREGEAEAGSLYRYFRGEVRRLFGGMTVPNSICFSPDGRTAYFSDTAAGILWRQAIDRAGWPSGKAEVMVDFSGVGLKPDGAVCDAEGNLWIAQWGAWRVACHGPDGRFRRALACGAEHVTCPAFGGTGLDEMFATSATEGLEDGALDLQPGGGRVWHAAIGLRGQAEHRVIV